MDFHLILIIYFTVTGTMAAIGTASMRSDTDIQVYYFVMGFLFGWITVPIKFVKGFIKTYKEIEEGRK